MKRALVIRHVPHEGLAGLTAPVRAAGYAIEEADVGAPGFAGLDLGAPDLLVLMGGPMAVYERDEHPWIADELARLRERLRQDRPTLGICLGAQIIAAALGSAVTRAPRREVGFAPIAPTGAGAALLAPLSGVPVLHWHGDMFAVPAGATLLAETAIAPQAFAKGRVLAFQCHPEMGDPDDGIARWCEGADAYVAQAGTSCDAIRADHARYGAAAAAAGRIVVTRWLAGLA